MDFFENQHKAKRNSGIFYLLFLMVIVGFVFTVMLITAVFLTFSSTQSTLEKLSHPYAISAGIIAIIIYCIGSFIEWRRLAGGGKALAKRMGAKPLYHFKVKDAFNQHETLAEPTFTAQEKLLLTVVENMAIASGVGKPDVFLLPHESSINAFVAGYQENDMVLVVTQGALTHLLEDELYALVAHEFSHIAHGDTQINLKLLIMLGGLQVFYDMGKNLFDLTDDDRDDSISYSTNSLVRQNQKISEEIKQNISKHSREHPSRYNTTQAHSRHIGGFMLLGAAVIMVSMLGVVFARFFKYALLRQREYLADAASIQYTRSHALLRLLEKVRELPSHGGIRHVSTESISHFFFVQATPSTQLFHSVLSTHPSLDNRIKAISEQRYHWLKKRDDITAQHLEKKRVSAAEKRQNVADIRKAYQFEYKEKSDYDGTPVDFVSADTLQNNKPAVLTQQHTQPAVSDTMQTIAAIAPKTTSNLEIAQFNADLIDPLIDLLNTPRGCLELIAACLACHQQTDISPLQYEVSVSLYQLLQDKPRSIDTQKIIEALDALAQRHFRVGNQAALLYMSRLQRITEIDGTVSLLEALILERVAFQLGLQPKFTEIKATDAQVATAFKMLTHAVLVNDQHTAEERASIRSRMQKLVNIPDAAFAQAKAEKMSLGQCIQRLAAQPAARTHSILATIETTMLADGKLSQDEQDMLSLLAWRLSLGYSKSTT